MRVIAGILACLICTGPTFAGSLVSKETIDTFKGQTKIYRLKNRIPVIYRNISSSDILHIRLSFSHGIRDLQQENQTALSLLMPLLTRASDDYSKDEVFKITEKYALSPSCSAGLEQTICDLSTVNDYWLEGLKLFASLIQEPEFDKEDIELFRERLVSGAKSASSDPETVSEDAADTLFWGKSHPYELSINEQLQGLPKVTKADLEKNHAALLNAKKMYFTVVGSLPEKDLLEHLNKAFGEIEGSEFERTAIPPAKFDPEHRFQFVDRKIPTAYINIAYNAPKMTDTSYVTFRLLTRILNEELWDEVRSRRSLSYAIHASYNPLNEGAGTISASTSKPDACLQAIQDVLYKLAEKEYTRSELEEQKTIYTTSYYLSQEEHSSIASSLAWTYYWFKNTDHFYEFPQKLHLVTPREIKEMAQEWLRNMRVAVTFERTKFQDKAAFQFMDNFTPSKLWKRKKKSKQAQAASGR